MTTKIVLLNATPRAGKDSTADKLIKENPWYTTSFKHKLVQLALDISLIPKETWDQRYEEEKDVPWDQLGGLSQRQFLIKISEEWIKPVFGGRYFGEALVDNILDSTDTNFSINSHLKDEVFIISDSGFDCEIPPIIEEFGKENVLILRWGRIGCSFEYDSRGWVSGFPSITKDLPNNNSTLEVHVAGVEKVIKTWLR